MGKFTADEKLKAVKRHFEGHESYESIAETIDVGKSTVEH